MGLAASAICSADCAARLDQASRLKVEGRRPVWSGDMVRFPWSRLTDNVGPQGIQTHPFPDKAHENGLPREWRQAFY
jgi:hypothetical protein